MNKLFKLMEEEAILYCCVRTLPTNTATFYHYKKKIRDHLPYTNEYVEIKEVIGGTTAEGVIITTLTSAGLLKAKIIKTTVPDKILIERANKLYNFIKEEICK